LLFQITEHGVVWPHAPKAYESDMPVFGGKLSHQEFGEVLSYIKKHWKSNDILSTRQEMARNV
jgi:hypothetical protein